MLISLRRRNANARTPGAIVVSIVLSIVFAITMSCESQSGELLWKIDNGKNTVYIQASIPFLPPDETLKQNLLAVYAESAAIVFENDVDNFDDSALKTFVTSSGMLDPGQTLDSELGTDGVKALQRWSGENGLDAKVFSHFKPWIIALTIAATEITKQGWNTAFGLDPILAQRATADGKTIEGIAPVEDEAKNLAKMPGDLQRAYVSYTLLQAKDLQKNADTYIRLWRDGNANGLSSALGSGFKDRQDLYQAIVVDRYKNWLPRIDAMLAEPAKRLVVLDFRYLVGPEGLIEALKKKNYGVSRL